MAIKETLLKLGFKKQQASIYLACLELGKATVSQIAEKSGIQRTYCYDLLEDLVNRGFVVQMVQGKRRYFLATNPEWIVKAEKEKLKIAEEVLPQIKSIYNISGIKPGVSFYEGRKGLDEVYNDTLRYKGEIISFTTEKFLLADGKELGKDYIRKRVKADIPVRVIGPVSQELLEIKKRDKEELRQTKMLPRDIFTSDIEIGIYMNKVDFINFNKEFGLIIESEEIADVMRKIFEIIWKGGFVID